MPSPALRLSAKEIDGTSEGNGARREGTLEACAPGPNSERLEPQKPSLRDAARTPLAELVSRHLQEQGIRQVDFCRQTGFDQGLLSKILSSVVNSLNVETALKLAEGMSLPPAVVFDAIGKREVHELLVRIYHRSSEGECPAGL